jgi:hypothetical protein
VRHGRHSMLHISGTLVTDNAIFPLPVRDL